MGDPLAEVLARLDRSIAGNHHLAKLYEAARDALAELLRLYDWRFELAKREKDPRSADKTFRTETRRLLNQYGAEKKAAWEAARRALTPVTTEERIVELESLIATMSRRMSHCSSDEEFRIMDRRLQEWLSELARLRR